MIFEAIISHCESDIWHLLNINLCVVCGYQQWDSPSSNVKLQWSIQPRHKQLTLDQVTHLNYRNMYIWPPTQLDNITWSLTFDSTFNHNIWSFWSIEAITSHCESDIWHFTLENKPLAFRINIHCNFWLLSLFPSRILEYATGFCSSISLFIWRFTFGELFLTKHE